MRSRGSADGAPCAWLDAADRARRLRPWLRPRHGAAMRREVSLNTKKPDGPDRIWLEPECSDASAPKQRQLDGGCHAMTTEALKAAAEIMEWLKDSWGAHNARDSDVPNVADAFNAFAARKVAEAVAAERERIARRVSEQQILRFQVGRDPLEEVNEIIQDLAHDIATDWEDYE